MTDDAQRGILSASQVIERGLLPEARARELLNTWNIEPEPDSTTWPSAYDLEWLDACPDGDRREVSDARTGRSYVVDRRTPSARQLTEAIAAMPSEARQQAMVLLDLLESAGVTQP